MFIDEVWSFTNKFGLFSFVNDEQCQWLTVNVYCLFCNFRCSTSAGCNKFLQLFLCNVEVLCYCEFFDVLCMYS